MPEFDFTLVIADRTEFTDDEANVLHEAGCDDGLIGSSSGVAFIDFGREAPTLVEAIRSAMADVKKAGMRVARIEIEAAAMEGVIA